MKDLFNLITEDEKQKLVNSIAYVTVLIAGADGKINNVETEWAEKLTKIRSFAHHKALQNFYETVGSDFHDKLESLISSLPTDNAIRANYLTEKIAEINPILQKLPIEYGAILYQSLTSFAKHVAKASGGFLGFASISANEAKLIGLKMLTPIMAIVNDEDFEMEDEENEE